MKERIKYGSMVGYYARSRGRGKTLRPICESCRIIDIHGHDEVAYYLKPIYVKYKKKLIRVGLWCPNCENSS